MSGMADGEMLRLQNIYKQTDAAARAAEGRQRFARTSQLQRQAEREAAQTQEDHCRRQYREHASRVNLEPGLRKTLSDAEFACKMAGERVKAAVAVAAQAEIDHTEARRAAASAQAEIAQKRDGAGVAAVPKPTTSEPPLRDSRLPTRRTMDDSPLSSSDWDQGPGRTFRRTESLLRRGNEAKARSDEEAKAKRLREEAAAKTVETQAALMESLRRQKEEQQRKGPTPGMVEAKHQRKAAFGVFSQRLKDRAARPTLNHRVWKARAETALQDVSAVKVFPEPPAGICTKPDCIAGKHLRALDACACDIETAFTLLELPLREARTSWHPDRWSKSQAESRDEFQIKAKEIFQVVMKMYEKEKERENVQV